MLKGIGQRLGVAKDCVCVQDYKESFCQIVGSSAHSLRLFLCLIVIADLTILLIQVISQNSALRPGSRVTLYYKMKHGNRDELGYQNEVMMPVYENLYVRQFVLYSDESISYYFIETKGYPRIPPFLIIIPSPL